MIIAYPKVTEEGIFNKKKVIKVIPTKT